jgi:hypothetical protein
LGQGQVTAIKQVTLFAKTPTSSVDVFDAVTEDGQPDPNAKKGSLVNDPSLGNLRAGKLTDIRLKQANGESTHKPTGELQLYFSHDSIEDLWLALAWGSN